MLARIVIRRVWFCHRLQPLAFPVDRFHMQKGGLASLPRVSRVARPSSLTEAATPTR
jgi:hypothetical protein